MSARPTMASMPISGAEPWAGLPCVEDVHPPEALVLGERSCPMGVGLHDDRRVHRVPRG